MRHTLASSLAMLRMACCINTILNLSEPQPLLMRTFGPVCHEPSILHSTWLELYSTILQCRFPATLCFALYWSVGWHLTGFFGSSEKDSDLDASFALWLLHLTFISPNQCFCNLLRHIEQVLFHSSQRPEVAKSDISSFVIIQFHFTSLLIPLINCT